MSIRSSSPRGSRARVRVALAAALLLSVAPAVAPVSAQPVGATEARPDRPEAAFERARLLYDARLFAAAERAFGEFLGRYPSDARAPEALYHRAESALAAEDAAAAAALFTRFERAHPGHPFAPRARLALGRYYLARGQDALAEDALAAAADAAGPAASRAEAAYLLGLVLRRQGRSAAAADAFERAAADTTPTAGPALYALATLHIEADDWAAAATALRRLRDRTAPSADDSRAGLALAEALIRTGQLAEGADEAARRRPALAGDAAARAALLEGEARIRLGRADAADAVLADVPPDSRYARRAALARGRIASNQNRLRDAVDFYTIARAGAADRATDDAIAHEASYYSALALRALGQLGDAEDRLAATVERAPDGAYAEAARLELGFLRYERRRYDAAAATFDALLEANPRGPFAGEAARMLGEAYAAAGDTGRAREAFRLAERLGTATAETRTEVAFQDAYALFEAGQYPEAVSALLTVADADPRGPRAGEALFWAGEAAFQAGDYPRAASILEALLERFPAHARADAARYVIAWTFYQRGQTQGAAAAFERFLSAYTRSGELVPYYADALLRLGDLYTVLGRYADARLVYGRVPAATPDRQGGDYALFQTAQAFGREGRADDALASYAQLLREYPQSERYAQALLARGGLYSARGQDSLAVAAYERVLRERPASGAAAYVGIGDVLSNQGRPALAEAAYRRVLERYPASPFVVDAFGGLADALAAQGRGSEIDAAFAEADGRLREVEPRARLRYARAQLALTSGQDSLAITYLEEALAGPPPPDLEQEALLALGGALAGAGRPADAARALRRLVTRYPDSPLALDARYRLAEALLANGDATGALDVAGILRTRPGLDDDRAADGLALEARALRSLDRTAEADDVLRLLLRRFPATAAGQATLDARPDLAPPAADDDGGDAP